MSERDRFAVAGRPVGHSLSPLIFKTFFDALGTGGTYLRLAASGVRDLLPLADSLDLRGMNVTAPFKEDVLSLLRNVDLAGRKIGAVNCLVREGSAYRGYNTDHLGVVGALIAHGFRIRGSRAAILGAGGAARAAAYGLSREGAERIVIVNRTAGRATHAAAMIGCRSAPLGNLDEILGGSDLLVSGVPSGGKSLTLRGDLGHLTVLDADYRSPSLAQAAAALGASVVDGRQWLLYQALPSFRLMTGREAPAGTLPKLKRELLMGPGPVKRHLALLGFMGAGKTTAGRLLAERIGRTFVDTDSLVEDDAGLTIPEIFRSKGETFFRQREKEAVRRAVSRPDPAVIALGGGAVLDDANVSCVREACRTVWLWVSADTALARIPARTRPLVDPGHPGPGTADLLAVRMPLYAGACDFVVNADEAPAQAVAERIAHEMD